MTMLKFSFIWRCASVATVSKTIDDLPEPETPVKIVILRLGIFSDMFLRLFSRAPRISMYSWVMCPILGTRDVLVEPHGTLSLNPERRHLGGVPYQEPAIVDRRIIPGLAFQCRSA